MAREEGDEKGLGTLGLNMTIGELLDRAVRKDPNKVFLYFEDREISYGAFDACVNRLSHGLLRLGIGQGDRVCLMLPNSPEFLYTWFALARIGAIMVPVNTGFKAEEARHVLFHSESVAAVVAPQGLEVMEQAGREAPHLRQRVCVGQAAPAGMVSFYQLMEDSPPTPPHPTVTAADLASFVYTSGTTGPPKAAMQTHRAYVLAGEGFVTWVGATSQDRLMTCLPLFHINAQAYSTMGALAAGASLVLVERFSLSRFWDQVRHYRANIFNAIGAMLMLLYKQSEGVEWVENPARLVYTVPALPTEVHQDFERKFGLTVLVGYGLSECPYGCVNPLGLSRKVGSLGPPRRHPHPTVVNEVKVVDGEGKEVPPGMVGEIVLRNPALFMGYYKDPEKTAEVLRDGWFHTGDSGWMDEDGFFWFVAREKDLIRRRGENISPVEVEQAIEKHPKVLEAAVIAVPSELTEDEVKAYVVPKPGEHLSAEEVVAWCQEQLATFKVPRYIELRHSLPKTPTQRVAKNVLRSEKTDLTQGCYDREAQTPR